MKNSRNSLKIPHFWGAGGSDQKKIFCQKVITHQDATFLGQKFFCKTNILGFRIFFRQKALKSLKYPLEGEGGPTQKKIFFQKFQLIKTNIFCDKSFALKSIFQKIEKKIEAFRPIFDSPNFRGISQGG